MNGALAAALLLAALPAVAALRRPLKAAGKLALRSAAGLGGIWAFNFAGSLIGVQVGVNLFTGLTVGLLGLPGFGLLLLLQCI